MEKIEKNNTKKIVGLIVLILCFCLAGVSLYYVFRPKLTASPYTAAVFDLGESKALLEDGRQCGYVNLDNFIRLASSKDKVFNKNTDVKRERDSVIISTKDPSMFFGIDNGVWWRNKYENLPVSFPDNYSFKAALSEQNHVEYIYIPYQILSCLVAYCER